MSRSTAEAAESGTLQTERTVEHAEPGRHVDTISRVLLPLALAAIAIGIWQLAVTGGGHTLVPTPANTAAGFARAVGSADDWAKTAQSWISLGIGYGISVAIGVTLGLLLGYSRLADRTIGIYVDIALVTPMVVLMPIVLIALGVTRKAEIGVVMLFATPYIIMPVRNGVRSMPSLWFELARSLCASRRQVWRFVLLPGARAVIATGLRLGLAHALSGLLVVELTLVSLGIGQVILTDKANFAFDDMFGYVLLVMAQVVVVLICIGLFERWVSRRTST